MPEVGNDRQPYRFFIQLFGKSGPAHPAAVFQTGMFSDFPSPPGRTPGKQFPDPPAELPYILLIQILSSYGFPLRTAFAYLGVGQALRLGLCQGLVAFKL